MTEKSTRHKSLHAIKGFMEFNLRPQIIDQPSNLLFNDVGDGTGKQEKSLWKL